MKITKIVLSTVVVAFGLVSLGSKVSASTKPSFFVGRTQKGVYIKTTKGNVEFHVKAVKGNKHISDGIYITKPGTYYIAGGNDPIIGKAWKNSELYITKLSKKQMNKEDVDNNYSSKGIKKTLVKEWY